MAILDQINRITEEVGFQTELINQVQEAIVGKHLNQKKEQEKIFEIIDNGNYIILPDNENTVISKAIIKVAVPLKEEEEKQLEIAKNGIYDILPTEGNVFSKVSVNINVEFEKIKPYIDTSKIKDFSFFFSEGSRFSMWDEIDFSAGEKYLGMFENFTNDALSSNGWPEDLHQTFYINVLSEVDIGTPKNLVRFAKNSELITFPKMNTSKCTNFNSFCMYNRKIQELNLDITNGIDFNQLCYGCTALKKVTLTKTVGDLQSSSFYNCTALTNVILPKDWDSNIYLNYSTKLTSSSLHKMIENLANLEGKPSKTFQIGIVNLSKVDAEHLTMLQTKNWNYS